MKQSVFTRTYYMNRSKKENICNYEDVTIDLLNRGYVPVDIPLKNSKGVCLVQDHIVSFKTSDDEIIFFDNDVYDKQLIKYFVLK